MTSIAPVFGPNATTSLIKKTRYHGVCISEGTPVCPKNCLTCANTLGSPLNLALSILLANGYTIYKPDLELHSFQAINDAGSSVSLLGGEIKANTSAS